VLKTFLLVGSTLLFLSRALGAQQEQDKKPRKPDQDLSELSLEDLMKVEITSVSKSEQSLMDAPAAVTVIRAEDIRRTGATSIPEALRLVPGISVARLSSNKWVVASRGFSDLFSTKLLVLIDGRSVYTPLFSGVLWPAQDVDLEDVDRIESHPRPRGHRLGRQRRQRRHQHHHEEGERHPGRPGHRRRRHAGARLRLRPLGRHGRGRPGLPRLWQGVQPGAR